MADDVNSTFNFDVNGLGNIEAINKVLAAHNATIDDVAKAYKKFNTSGEQTSQTLKGLTSDYREFEVVTRKTKKGLQTVVESVQDASNVLPKFEKQLKAINAIKMVKGVGISDSTVQQYTKLAKRLDELKSRLKTLQGLEAGNPQNAQARQAKIRDFQEQIRLTQQLIVLAKEELQLTGQQAIKDANAYEKAVRKQARQAKAAQEQQTVAGIPMAAGVGPRPSAAQEYIDLQNRMDKLRERMAKLRELDLDTPEGKKARRDRIRDFQEQIRLTQQRIALAKEDLRLTSEQARKAAIVYEKSLKQQAKQAKVVQDRAAVDAVPRAQAYMAGPSSAENYMKLTERMDQLKARLIALRNLELDTTQGKQYRREKIQYTQESIRLAQKRIELLKEDLRLTGQQAIKEAENNALRQKYKNILTDVNATKQLQVGLPSGLANQKQYLDQFLAAKKQLITADQKLASIQKSQYATPKDKARIQWIRENITLLKQQAEAEIKVARAAIASANAQAKQKQINDSKFFLNLDNAARVGQFILLHRVFMGFAGAIKQGANDAREFSIRIGEIRTISDRNATSTEQWSEAIRRLSSAFGEDLGTTARGIYEAISNQVVRSANDVSFFEQNMRLAKTTVATFDEAINATTSVINAFGMSVADTEEIAGVLFKTVDIGRVRLSEMANTLGRVSILSNALGISFKEQQAALAALSIQGVKHATAETYLVNIFQKMVRPSDRMAEVFAELGVSSGEVAYKTFGLAGMVELLGDVAKESGDEMAEMGELFQRIRATTGSVALSQDKLNNAMAKMADSTEQAKLAYEEMYNTVGARLERQTQALKNMFTIDIGTQFNKMLLKVADAFGGLANAVTNAAAAIAALTTGWLVLTKSAQVVTAFTAIASAVKAATTALYGATAATAAFGTTAAWATGGLSLLAAAIAFVGVRHFTANTRLEETIRIMQQEADKVRENSTAYTELKTSIDSFTDTQTAATQAIRQNIAGFARDSYRELKRTEEAFKDIVRFTGYAIDATKDAASAAVDKVKESVDEMEESIEGAYELIQDATFESAETLFGNTIERLGFWADDAEKVIDNKLASIQERMQELSEEFYKANSGLYGKNGGKIAQDAVKEYQALQQESKAYEEQLKNIDKVGEETLSNQIAYADQEANRLMAAGIAAAGSATTPQQQEVAQKQIELAEKMFAKRNELLDQYTEKYETDLSVAQQRMIEMQNQELFVIQQKAAAQEKYIAITQAALAEEEKRKAKKEAALKELEYALGEIGKFDYGKQSEAEFAKLYERVKSAMAVGEFDPSERLTIMKDLITNYYAQVKQSGLEANQELAKQTQQQMSFLDQQIEASVTKIKDLEDKRKNASVGLLKPMLDQAKKLEAMSNGAYFKRLLENPERLTEDQLNKVKSRAADYDALKEILYKLASGQDMSSDELIAKYERLRQISMNMQQEGLKTNKIDEEEIANGLVLMKQAYAILEQTTEPYQIAVEQSQELANIRMELVNSQAYLNNLGAYELQIQRQMVETYREQLRLLNDRAAATTGRLPGVNGPGGNFALGGFRGNDRSMAYFDPREFIVNAEASRTYAPFLKAINGSRMPHFAQGGSVTNVGDIQVSVAGGATSAQTIQEIAQGINREIRLGRIKLNVR